MILRTSAVAACCWRAWRNSRARLSSLRLRPSNHTTSAAPTRIRAAAMTIIQAGVSMGLLPEMQLQDALSVPDRDIRLVGLPPDQEAGEQPLTPCLLDLLF